MDIKKRDAWRLVLTLSWSFSALFAVVELNTHLLPRMGQPWLAIAVVFLQWIPALLPLLLFLLDKENPEQLGWSGKQMGVQVVIGLGIALAMSLVLTILPIAFGMKDWVGSTSYTQPWQFAYEFIYCILGVAAAEEFLFRGYLLSKLRSLTGSKWGAIAISSALFGLFHIFSGNPVQVVLTALIGFFLCVCKEQIPGCSLLSLILAHGIHNALIVLFVAIL